MKKVLVTGAAGIIGINVVKYLLSEGKYEITLLDLKNKRSFKRLKRYSKRVNIVYGDVNNEVLVDALVKDHDVVIHLAGALPPLANLKKDLCRIVDYEGTKNFVNAIRMYNRKCLFIYVSSTTVYGKIKDNDNITVSSKVNIHEGDWYSKYKYDAERLIKGEIRNYVIYRVPSVVANISDDSPIYNVPLKSKIELVSAKDVAYALVNTIDNYTKLDNKIYNLSGGKNYQIEYKKHLINLLKSYGISMRFIVSRLLIDKNFYSGWYADSDKINDVLNYQTEGLDVYYRRLARKYRGNKRIIQRLLAKPIIYIMNRKG